MIKNIAFIICDQPRQKDALDCPYLYLIHKHLIIDHSVIDSFKGYHLTTVYHKITFIHSVYCI